MSKRRKNAGEGYGYMFHGAFSKKADAVAKERKTKGAWVKGVLTNTGQRYIVMSPRTNPIKRKKRTKPVVESYAPRVPNPTELLVMGGNPHNPHENVQEIVLQPGSKLVIRNNPVDARPNSLGSFFGFSPSKPTKKQLAESRRSFKRGVREKGAEMDADLKRMKRAARASQKQSRTARVFHEVYGRQLYDKEGLPSNPAICGAMIGGYPRSRHSWGPRGNPSAEAIRERFTGAPVDRVQIFDEPHMPAGDYAMLGKLLSPGLYIKPRHGGQVMHIDTHGTIMVSDERGHAEEGKLGPIWFVRGDQDVSDGLHHFGALDRGAGVFELGHLVRVDYQQRKEHVEHPEQDKWKHMMGEESGVRPMVLFDSRTKRLLLEGGDYVIRPEGIVN